MSQEAQNNITMGATAKAVAPNFLSETRVEKYF